jgi:hypothetical protein
MRIMRTNVPFGASARTTFSSAVGGGIETSRGIPGLLPQDSGRERMRSKPTLLE